MLSGESELTLEVFMTDEDVARVHGDVAGRAGRRRAPLGARGDVDAQVCWFRFAASVLLAGACQIGGALPAMLVDPPHDAAHPARMEVLHIPSGGVEINGVAYLAAGAGTHPTLVIAHGWPGNEKNLDLAQAVRRAGWNAVTFNYRGSWGSPGEFHFAQVPEDAANVIA